MATAEEPTELTRTERPAATVAEPSITEPLHVAPAAADLISPPMASLPDDVLRHCLAYVGPGCYRYVAGTCRAFRDSYRSVLEDDAEGRRTGGLGTIRFGADGRLPPHDRLAPRTRRTGVRSAASSASCARLCLEEVGRYSSSSSAFDGRNLPLEIAVEAAYTGNLDVLRYAVERGGCPLDSPVICSGAASGGHLDVLRWAREKGCPWDSGTRVYARRAGHLEVERWARENGCEANGPRLVLPSRRGL